MEGDGVPFLCKIPYRLHRGGNTHGNCRTLRTVCGSWTIREFADKLVNLRLRCSDLWRSIPHGGSLFNVVSLNGEQGLAPHQLDLHRRGTEFVETAGNDDYNYWTRENVKAYIEGNFFPILVELPSRYLYDALQGRESRVSGGDSGGPSAGGRGPSAGGGGAGKRKASDMSKGGGDGSGSSRKVRIRVRVYGDGLDLFFNRDEGIKRFECLSEHCYGPKLFGQFKGGRVEEFIYARTLSSADLRDPVTATLIASKMRDFHKLEMPGAKEPLLWNRLRSWLVEAKNLCTPDNAEEYQLDALEQEIALLEKEISKDHQEIGFCHNDMQHGNIMIDINNSIITIIDYEYASYNPIAYDIANHFCEMAANYYTDTPHILDYTQYPGVEERKRFIGNYLSSSGNEASKAAVDQLADDVEKFTLANHIFWGLCGLILSYVNHIEFDYKEYARQRFEQYWLRKPAILNVGVDDNDTSNDSTKLQAYVNHIEFDYKEYARQRFEQYWMRKPAILKVGGRRRQRKQQRLD